MEINSIENKDVGKEWFEHADMEVIQDGIDDHNYCGINMDMSEDELQHWGIKGMKWGVRRYQNRDGSLTPAGRKRYNEEVEALKAQKAKLEERAKNKRAQERMQARTDKLRAEIDELKGKKKPEKSADDTPEVPKETGRKKRGFGKSNKPKKPEEMTLEELNEEINRMKAIQQYNSYYSQLHPPKVNKGAETVKKFFDEAVVPAVTKSAKDLMTDGLTKLGKEALGLNEKKVISELEQLQDAVAKTKAMKEIAQYKDDIEKIKNPKIDYEAQNRQEKAKEEMERRADESRKARERNVEDLELDAREEKARTEAERQRRDRDKLVNPEVDYEAENKRIKAERENAQLKSTEWQQRQMEKELAEMDTKIGAGSKYPSENSTKTNEQIAKEILNNTKSIPNPTKEDIKRVEDMLDDEDFWFDFDNV